MKWSWRLGSVAGIPVFIHSTFWILVALVGFTHLSDGTTAAGLLSGVGFLLAIFGCVLLHELGHALAARRYGIRTRDIILLPLGGVARLEKMPEKPSQEIAVALAGPAVNVAIAAVLFVGLWLGRAFVPISELGIAAGPFLERLLAVNVLLALFNLLPAFPMDGGRVLRALLALRLPYDRATRVAAGVGQGMAVLLGILGFFVNPFLILIAFFVFMGAGSEARHVSVRSTLSGTVAGQAMLRSFRTISPGDTLERALTIVMSGAQEVLPVIARGELLGFTSEAMILGEIDRRGPGATVAGAIEKAATPVRPDDPLPMALDRMVREEVPVLPVNEHGRLVGLLTARRIQDFARWRTALGKFADIPMPGEAVEAEGRPRDRMRVG